MSFKNHLSIIVPYKQNIRNQNEALCDLPVDWIQKLKSINSIYIIMATHMHILCKCFYVRAYTLHIEWLSLHI